MDKNNTKNLVTGVDDDPTSELEILSHSLQLQDLEYELESDAVTYNCEDDSDDVDSSKDGTESLRRCIRERDESIARLQYDFEQLLSRWNGLDKEIKVREKLTENVNAELRQAKNELAAMQTRLRGSQAAAELQAARIAEGARSAEENSKLIESLRIAADLRDRRVAELELQESRYERQLREIRDQLGTLQSEARSRADERETLEAQLRANLAMLQDADNRISALTEQLAAKDAVLAQQTKETEFLQQLHARQATEIENLQQQRTQQATEIDNLQQQHAQQTTEIDNLQQQHAQQTTEIDNLQQQLTESREDLTKQLQINSSLHAATTDKSESSARQKGLLVNSRLEIRELQSQVGRTEGYADSLRVKLQTQTRIADEATRACEQTDMVLADARRQIAELGGYLESEKLMASNLREQLDEIHSEFEGEISRVRVELAAAQQTIADHETIHEQLTADLFESQSFRQVLESQLEKTEESNETLIRTLRQKVKRLEQQQDDDRHKISNKDGAIAALLNELANRSSTALGSSEMDHLATDEPNSQPDIRPDDKSAADRITRLLVGNIDGQELRFPLFKDKLTIGRTRNNDIHLKAQYISRRHALIVTENDRTKIVDWGSKNGIAVNKQPVSEQVLRSGDIVTIGNADFRYEERPKR
jgi:chromosome segregation ATPase